MSNRLYANIGNEIACPFKCIYCFVDNDSYKAGININKVSDSELKEMVKGVDIIQPACDSELLLQKNWKDILIRLVKYKKSISFATKMIFKDEDIKFLASINKELKQSNQILNIGVTIISTNSYKELEPYAPKPEERIKLLNKLYAAGIGCNVIIRPLFPTVSYDELEEIIIKTYRNCYGYLVGPLYVNSQVNDYLKKKNYNPHLDKNNPDWNQNASMNVIHSRKSVNKILETAQKFNQNVFLSNSQCVDEIKDILFSSNNANVCNA